MKSKFQLTATMVAIYAIGLTGCGGGTTAGAKSGGQVGAVTIRLGTVEGKDAPYADEVEHFAKSVETMSNQSLNVDIVWEAPPGKYHAESEKDLANMVSKGDIDLAIVPTRVWDQLEVTTLQALQTPFLVDSVGLVNKIVGSDMAGEMMAGLDTVGVDGLALWPDSMRHPVGFGAPLLTADDFRGVKLLMPISDLSYRFARTMGVDPVNPPDWAAAVAAGQMQGAESAFAWADHLPAFGTFTANVTFYPKVNTVAANKRAFEKLTPARQDVLRRAATETLTYVESTTKSDHDLAAGYCAQGGGVALADEATLSDLTKLAKPLVAELEQQADTKRLISEIRTMKAQTTNPDPLPVACERKTHDAPVTTETGVVTASFPEGVYRTNSPLDGVVTMSYIDGVWKRFEEDGKLDCEATYVLHSGRMWMSMSTDSALSCGWVPGTLFLDASWTLDGDQLRFTDINSDPGAVREFSLPWTWIELGGNSQPEQTTFPEGAYRTKFSNMPTYTGFLPGPVVITFTFKNGTWFATDDQGNGDCGGTYAVESGRIRVNVSTDVALRCGYPPGSPFWDATWTFDNNELRFADLNSDRTEAFIMGSQPWTKIG